jgi:hypothetical protein
MVLLNSFLHGRSPSVYYIFVDFLNKCLHVRPRLVYDASAEFKSSQNHHVTRNDIFFTATVATFMTFLNVVTKFALEENFTTISARNARNQ